MNLTLTLATLLACLFFTWKRRQDRRPFLNLLVMGFGFLSLCSAYYGSAKPETELAQLGALRQAVAIHCGETLKPKGPILFFIPPQAAPEIRQSYDDAIRLLTECSGSKFSPAVIEVNSLSEGRGFSLESLQAGLKQHPECRLIVSYAGLPGDLSLENCREWLPDGSLALIEGNPETALDLQREGAPIDLIIRPRADQDLPPPGTLVEGSPEEVFKRYFTPSTPTKN